MLAGVVQVVVDPHNQGQVLAAGRRGDDHFLGAAGEMAGRFVGVGENAGGFHDQVNAHFPPGDSRRIPLGKHLDAAPVHHQIPVAGLDLAGVAAIAGIILEQVGVSWGRR